MTRAQAGLLLLVVATGAACSRARVFDDGPIASATSGGIPPAASSAYIASPEGEPVARLAPSVSRMPLDPLAPSSSGGGHPTPHVHDDGASLVPTGLPVEVVGRIVRQNFGRFRLCYENGLRIDPGLEGSVRTRFIIEVDGSVGTVSDAGSTLGDKGVVACVQRGLGGLSFPQPTTMGAVTVTYSLSFTAS